MIPHIPKQRQHAFNAGKPFGDLVKYLETDKGKSIERKEFAGKDRTIKDVGVFSDLLNYETTTTDKLTGVDKCIAMRTHAIVDLKSASIEMNAVAMENKKCLDPAYHLILSWPEHEKPEPEAMFDAAEHAIKQLGLSEHQYVLAIHDNTDNRHCHIAVNRVHPTTFKSQHIEWAIKTLHLAARQSEIKHGWFHDNGIYVVQLDEKGQKHIVVNDQHNDGQDNPYAHSQDDVLPTWHDRDGLDQWLKTTVSRKLVKALPEFQNWNGLHSWLERYDRALADTGGGGQRMTTKSAETGEIMEMAVSKGLRVLKRPELEKRWGAYTPPVEPQLGPARPKLNAQQLSQLAKGADDVVGQIDAVLGVGTTYPTYIDVNRLNQHRAELAATEARALPQLPNRGLDGGREAGENASEKQVGALQKAPRISKRDAAKREERKQERAAARSELRRRFESYQRLARQDDSELIARMRAIRADRKAALEKLRVEEKAAKKVIKDQLDGITSKLGPLAEIHFAAAKRKLAIEGATKQKLDEARATRVPPKGWRQWLNEEAQLGDQTALSCLRGIVYQAQRDAKKHADPLDIDDDEEDEAKAITAEEKEAAKDRQYRRVMARLLQEEREEIAIRAAQTVSMRPWQSDSLLARYVDIHWHVTGNGNVEYSDQQSTHLFTDRGNRITFDRKSVTDDALRLALMHAQSKFGRKITLTGSDPIFMARMARMADDMNLIVLNTQLREVIASHRLAKQNAVIEAKAQQWQQRQQLQKETHTTRQSPIHPRQIKSAPAMSTKLAEAEPTGNVEPLQVPEAKQAAVDISGSRAVHPKTLSAEDRMKAQVLAQYQNATFEIADPFNRTRLFSGKIVAELNIEPDDAEEGFVQHIGRNKYVIHLVKAPIDIDKNESIDVRYRNQVIEASPTVKGKGIGGREIG